MKSIITCFRAYQLGSAGSSFSYFADGHFTVLEGRLTDVSKPCLVQEMANCGVETADTLHITSWDSDHCSASELPDLLLLTSPRKIEYPGYEPHSDSAGACLAIIKAYSDRQRHSNRPAQLLAITPEYIDSLTQSEALAFRDVLYHPRWIDECCMNNNSTVKFFRRGSFNLLSLGDVENADISARLRRDKYLSRETDVMILRTTARTTDSRINHSWSASSRAWQFVLQTLTINMITLAKKFANCFMSKAFGS